MELVISSLDKLIKDLSDEDFKYLVVEFGSKKLELLKQKGAYPYETVMKNLMKKNYLLKNILIALQKMEKSVIIVKYQTVT